MLNVVVPEYVSTRKSKAHVSYVRAPLYANMVVINNNVMIAEQSVSVSMENVVVAVKNAPEAPFVPIRKSEADAVNAEGVKYANILDVVNYARTVMVVESVLINYDITDAPNVMAETYANTAETKTGVFRVMVQMYANMIKSKHNVYHVMVDLFALIRSAVVFVVSARVYISVLIRNKRIYA